MNNKNFAHLHLHTQYSLLDGYGDAKEYAKKAKEIGFDYLAITDHMNVDGAIKFQDACKENDIKPIIGCELYIVSKMEIKDKSEKRGHITLLVKNNTGWHELCKLLTKANLEGFYKRPRIDYKYMASIDLSGFVIMTACVSSFLRQKGGIDFLNILKDKKADVYFEIMPAKLDIQERLHTIISNIKDDYNFPLVFTNDCHYIEKSDWKTQEVLLAIQRRAKWDDPNRWHFDIKDLHLRTADEMAKDFKNDSLFGMFTKAELMGAMRNTIKIAKKCESFVITEKEISLPDVKIEPPDPGSDNSILWPQDENEQLMYLCQHGYHEIFHKPLSSSEKYSERVLIEFGLIKKKGFARYFLIVYDIIKYAENNGIMVGPLRGSVGGSLIAFLIGITKRVDPLEFNLLFSRFLQEDRNDWPDIDIDFENNKRHLIRQYIIDTYGEENVCGISTFLKMQSRAAIRDVASTFDISNQDTDRFAKSIPKFGGTIKETSEGEGKWYAKKYPEVVRIAIRLEGQIKSAGQHPAGLIISKNNLHRTNKCSLALRKKNIVCNFDMPDAEYSGLIKLDALGLKTLSVLKENQYMIEENPDKLFLYHEGSNEHFLGNQDDLSNGCEEVDFDFTLIPLNDSNVFREIAKGNNAGIFQISSHLATGLCRDIKIDNFMEIASVLALGRPGPLDSGMTRDFIKRKRNQQWTKKHPMYEEITKETYGLLVYQEQIMQVISKVAGMSESTADRIRKVIAKKRDDDGFKKYKKEFYLGCKKQGTMTTKEAGEFWAGLMKWAKYGFGKAHSVGYALIAYWTAWLKYYCPLEFVCASLTYSDKKEEVIEEAKRLNIKIMPPKIDISDAIKWVVKDEILYAPFVELKPVDEIHAKKICNPSKAKNTGFFDVAETNLDDKFIKLLNEIKAYNKDEIPDNINDYFSLDIFEIKKEKRADKKQNDTRSRSGRRRI